MRAYLCDAWETDTPFLYSGNTKSGDEMFPTVDYLDISSPQSFIIIRQGVVMVTMMIFPPPKTFFKPRVFSRNGVGIRSFGYGTRSEQKKRD